MKKTVAVAMVAAAMAAAVCGCSREGREEAMDRMSAAGRALNGGETEGRVPDVVRKQREAEARRQNREWTPENQAKHPVEYCRAQLEVLDRNAGELGAAAHRISVAIGTVRRENGDDGAQLKGLEEFLGKAKAAYREAEAAGQWPASIGGYSLGRERAQEKIVEAARKIPELKERMAVRENQLVALDKKLARVNAEQKRLVAVRERVKETLRALETKQVIDGDAGIAAALGAISDSMGALAPEADNPGLEDLLAPPTTGSGSVAAEFEAIMAE
jgi:hypothetical protein